MKNFKELLVWQKAVDLVVYVYAITQEFPIEERYGLTNQMRRAVVSISSNIAEGHMRTTQRDFRHFIALARGSCAEAETQVIIAKRLRYINDEVFQNLVARVEEVAKMLSSFYSKL